MNFPSQLKRFAIEDRDLELFVPDAVAVKEAYKKGSIPFPYWSQVWPAAQALAAYLLQHPQVTTEKKVLEIGGGLGLPSLVAAQNATRVLCTDAAAEGLLYVAHSAAHLGIGNLATEVLHWQENGLKTADVLLLSDVNYNPLDFEPLLTLIRNYLRAGTTVLLTTPQRLAAKEFVQALLPYATHHQEIVVPDGDAFAIITLLVLSEKPNW